MFVTGVQTCALPIYNARVLGKRAACLLTISDSFVSPEITTAEQRQTSFTAMMKVALGVDAFLEK